MRLDPENRPRLLHLLKHAPRPADADGPPPSVDDLIALSDNTLNSERRRQVLAWLACDGELTRAWVQMQRDWERVRGESQQNSPTARRVAWRGLGPLAGLAAVATVVGLLVLPLWRGDPTAALDDLAWPAEVRPLHWALGAKSVEPAAEAPDATARAAFAAGVVTVLARAPTSADWARLRDKYAELGAASPCPGVCSVEQRSAWQRGRWAARVRLTCLSDSPPQETVTVLIAARTAMRAADAPAEGLELSALCQEAEQWFERYE